MARVCASEIGAGANAEAYKNAPTIASNAIGIAPQSNNDAGQRRFKSVVGAQTDCALPLGRPESGNSGEGLTDLVAAVIRLSQKTSRAFELSSAGLAFRAAGFL